MKKFYLALIISLFLIVGCGNAPSDDFYCPDRSSNC